MKTELKFKVGDKVRVKSLEWYNSEPKNNRKEIRHGRLGFTEEMKQYCGKVLKISKVSGFYYADSNDYGWEDWMLEDEVVTEQKETTEEKTKKEETTEVIKSMGTKEMTFKEAQAFLEGTKFICKSKEERDNVLSKIKTLGVGVIDTNSNSAYMFTIDDDNYLRHTISIVDWIEYKDKVIEPSEILAIQIKEEPKPKFDPKTLQPFDKVLVRDDENEEWRCGLFSHVINNKNDFNFQCVGSVYDYCIPYNDETKHLVGKEDEAPDFYKLDKKILSL